MDAGVIEQALTLAGDRAAGVTGLLVPAGSQLALWFTTLGVLVLALAIAGGGINILAPAVRFSAAAYATRWAVESWDTITRDALEGARAMTAVLIPGYTGPADLFAAAMNLGERMIVEQVAWSWSSPIASAIAGAMAAFIPMVVVIGLSMPAILAVFAEFQLLIGAAAAPLVLPLLAFPLTAPMGWGVVQFMLSQSVAIVVMGVTSVVLRFAMERVIQVPGSSEGLTGQDVWVLVILAVMSIVFGFGMTTVARNLVGGAMGALGLGTGIRTVGAAAMVGGSFGSVGSSIGRMMGGAAGSGVAGSGGRMSPTPTTAAPQPVPVSSGGGSPFRP